MGTCFQAVPFQCMLSATGLVPELKPTASMLLAEMVATPVR
jgi:hypothetical protein